MMTKYDLIQEYPASQLYNQILFLYNLVDKDKMKAQDDTLRQKLTAYSNGQAESQYDGLRTLIEKKYLCHNGYRTVALSKLFEGLFPTTINNHSTPAQA